MNVARYGTALLTVLLLWSCGEEGFDPRDICNESRRFGVEGTVGPSHLEETRAQPFEGITGETFLTVTLQSGESPHIIALSTNTVLDKNLWVALEERVLDGGGDVRTLAVTSRPADVPCDPREGVICAAFGIDTNRDGILFGADEVVYPAESGELVITDLNGNELEANYAITFGPLASGDEVGGDVGGALEGCFVLQRSGVDDRVY